MTQTSNDQLLSVNVLHEKYRFIKKLGKGGFADVFMAECRSTGELVAIKMIKSGTAGNEPDRKTVRFRREMQLYGKLDHPNIVKVIDSGETDNGILFIAFEFIKGKTLAELLKQEGALALARAIHLMQQVLNGLDEAHTKGIIHRDLKPENIMIVIGENSELVKILDFGISTLVQKPSDDSNRLTLTREFLGTPVYSAPEQLRGEAVSVKVDTYAWGLIFLECITGRSPFSGQTIAAVVQQQLASSPVPLPTAIINHQLGTLLRWVLEKKVARRAGNVTIIASHFKTVIIDTIPQKNGFLTGTFSDEDSDTHQVMVYETVSALPERRQVTVLCCTIELQTARSEISIEILDELYQDLMESCNDLVKRYGAYVASDSGDRIFAYFGYPDAGDTDAQRASRSALELANKITQRNMVLSKQHGVNVNFRIGINTGTITAQRHSHNLPVLSGLILNYAGKLCRIAHPNTILVSRSSFPLLHHTIELKENSNDLIDELLSDDKVYTMIGEKRCDSLIDIFTDNLSPMVGREGELARLCETWNATRTNNIGKVILLQGEAGIGKSRLAAEFAKKIAEEHCGWLECRCFPEGKNSALHPIISFLRNQFRIPDESLQKDSVVALEQHLNHFGIDCSIAVPIFGSWLGIAIEGYAMPEFSPQKQKEIILQLSSEILARAAQESCSIIMIEDLHWADPTTMEFLPKLFEQVTKRGVMLCMTARPVFVPSWNSTDVTVVSLTGLSDEYVEEIVKTIFGSDEIGRDTLAKIVSRVDGVPLFVEEIAKLIREKKLNKEEIPATLIDLLTGKMDQLGPARETAQLASVIGREFDYKLIEKVSDKDAASLLADLDHLISAGIIHLQLVVGNPHYVFHHALVRDAAYDSIQSDIRRKIHKLLVTLFIAENIEISIPQSGLISGHCAGAGDYKNAAIYGLKEVECTFERSNFIETITHAKQCMIYCHKIDDTETGCKLELKFNQILRQALIATHGFASDEILKVNERTLELAANLPDNADILFPAYWTSIIYYQTRADFYNLDKIFNQAFPLYQKLGSKNKLAALYFSKGDELFFQGSFDDAIFYLNETNRLFCDSNNQFVLNFGFDLNVSANAVLSHLYTVQGQLLEAKKTIAIANETSLSKGNYQSIIYALAYEAGMWHYQQNKVNTLIVADKLLLLSKDKEIVTWTIVGKILKGWASNDLHMIHETFPYWEQCGLGLISTYWNFVAAQTEFDNEKYHDCLKRIDFYISYAQAKNEIFYLPELYRLKGNCHYKLNQHDDCLVSFRNSLNAACQMNSKLFETRTLVDFIKSFPDKRDYYSNKIKEMYTHFNKYSKEEYFEKDKLLQTI